MGFSNAVSKITEMIWGQSAGDRPSDDEQRSQPKTIDLPPLKESADADLISSEKLSQILEEDRIEHELRLSKLRKDINQGSYSPESVRIAKAILSSTESEED